MVGIIRTMVDMRNNLAKEVSRELETHFEKVLFNTLIPRNVKLSEAPSFGIPAISYDANCKGSLSYLNLAKELVDNNENVKVSW